MFLSHLCFFFFFFSSHKCGTEICFSLLTARRVNFMWPLTPEKLKRNWSYKIKFLSFPCGNITNYGWHARELLKHLFGVETGSLWRGSGNVWKQEATGRNCSVQTDLPPVQPVRDWRNTRQLPDGKRYTSRHTVKNNLRAIKLSYIIQIYYGDWQKKKNKSHYSVALYSLDGSSDI